MALFGDYEEIANMLHGVLDRTVTLARQVELRGHEAELLREQDENNGQLVLDCNDYISRIWQHVAETLSRRGALDAVPDGESDGHVLAAMRVPALLAAEPLVIQLRKVVEWAQLCRAAKDRVRCVQWLGRLSRWWPYTQGTWDRLVLVLLVTAGASLLCAFAPLGTAASRWGAAGALLLWFGTAAFSLLKTLAAESTQRGTDISASIGQLDGVMTEASQLAAGLQGAGLQCSWQLVELILKEAKEAKKGAKQAELRLGLVPAPIAGP